MSFPDYIAGYWYPNDFAEPMIWMPIVFAYAITISGSAMLFLAYIAYLLGKLRGVISHMLVVGLSLFLVLLLGPLADLKAPDNAWRMMVSPRILPNDANPGFSLMAFQGAFAWPLAVLISILFTLLYFSYPLYLKYRETGNVIYRILSLGVSSEEKYSSLKKPLKILALVGSVVLVTWLVYPATLFMQTSNFVWKNSMLLPIIFFTEYLMMDISILVLLVWITKTNKLEFETLRSLITIIALASASAIIALLLQVVIWMFRFEGSPYYPAFTHLYSLICIAVLLYFIALLTSLLSTRYVSLSIVASLAGISGTMASGWNLIVRAQDVARTGLGILEPHIHFAEYAMIIGLLSLSVFLIVLLSSIFPMGFETKRRGSYGLEDQ